MCYRLSLGVLRIHLQVIPMRLILSLLFALAPSVSGAVVRDWPGVAPCHLSLVDCLNASLAGDTVRLNTNGSITEQIVLLRPVSLIAGPGFRPLFTATSAHSISSTESVPWTLTLRGLRFVGGSLFVRFNASAAGDVVLDQLRFTGQASDTQTQLGIRLQQTGTQPSHVRIANGDFVIGSDAGVIDSINFYGSASAGLQVTIEGNQFRPEAVPLSPTSQRAVSALVDGNSQFDVVFRRNLVLPALALPSRRFASGFAWSHFDDSHVDLLVHDNVLVLDSENGAGGSGLIAGGVGGGSTTIRVLNNSFVSPYNALMFYDNVSGRIDNNLISGVFRVHEGTAPASAFQFRNNLMFDVAQPSNWPLPPGTLTVAPQIDPRGVPLPGSPLIDAGSDAARIESGPGSFELPEALDAWGLPRVIAASIDIGAFEGVGEAILADGFEGATVRQPGAE